MISGEPVFPGSFLDLPPSTANLLISSGKALQAVVEPAPEPETEPEPAKPARTRTKPSPSTPED
jgi:hypothetical protein